MTPGTNDGPDAEGSPGPGNTRRVGSPWCAECMGRNQAGACPRLTIDGTELLLVRTGQDLLVQDLCVLVLSLPQVAGSLRGQVG